ncbi:hypothetical protein Tco_0600319 [Tanacetum coccineum]|uniref:Uncharacterized protein n=1 Tax=Tanacetum coccineum TaxID=301880 RepID=A0ABQ4WBK9_9ASTR
MGGGNFTHAGTEEPPSYTDGENNNMETQETEVEKEPKKETTKEVHTRPTRAVPISTVKPIMKLHLLNLPQDLHSLILSCNPISTTGSSIDITPPVEPEGKVPLGGSQVPYEIHGKVYQLTNDEVVQEEATKVGVDPKILASAKGGQEFKKIQDAKLQTTSSRLKPKPATDVKIHPNTKPAVLTVYRGNDRRNFDVHNPFKFADFGITKLDELGPIIEKKKNKIVVELMISLGKRYERLNKIPEELGIQSALLTLERSTKIRLVSALRSTLLCNLMLSRDHVYSPKEANDRYASEELQASFPLRGKEVGYSVNGTDPKRT